MQADLIATLSRLCRVLGDFRLSTDTLVQKLHYFSDFYPCSTGTNLPKKSHIRSGTRSQTVISITVRIRTLSIHYLQLNLVC